MNKINIQKLTISILLCLSAGVIGSLSTAGNISTWYQTLEKPGFTPPGWIFGPVWTTLYILMGISLYIVWQKVQENKTAKPAITFFLIQLFFNAIWSFLFFGLQNILLGFIDIILLWSFLLITILLFFRVSRIAGFLLLPYITWVSYAALLNYYILLLNT